MQGAAAEKMTSDARPSIFLSYSRQDRPIAEKVIAALEASGHDVWWDGLLEGGVAFARKTEDALETADAVVVLWSKTSIESHWVKDEATRGRDRGCLVPATIDGAEPPLGFRQYQVLDLSKWKGRADAREVADLLRAVSITVSGGHGASQTQSLRPLAARGKTGRRGFVVGGALGAAGLAGGIGAWWAGVFSNAVSANSVAVLPFRNLSGDPAQDYLSDGMSEEVRSTLARNPLLQVTAPTSTAKFRDRAEERARIAEKLNVTYLLDGSVQRAGDMIRIRAELMDGASGFSAWAERFDRKLDDIFAIQSEIATTVAAALSARIGSVPGSGQGNTGDDESVGATKVIAAYEAYLKGRAAYESVGGEDSDRQALTLFDQAIAADQKFAKAHAARSRTLASLANVTTQASELRLLYESAIVSAQTAHRLAPKLADAYSALGYALVRGRQDMRTAREPFEKSRVLGWGDADVLIRYADYCTTVGRATDAETAALRSAKLDPLNPRVFRVLGIVKSLQGNHKEAIALFDRALAINPKMAGIWAGIGLAHFRLGALDNARAAYARETFSLFQQAGLSIIDHKRGQIGAADAALNAIIAEYGDNALYQKAQILAQRGAADGAIDALERGHAIGDAGLLMMRNDPFLDPIRTDPRFIRLLKRMGFD